MKQRHVTCTLFAAAVFAFSTFTTEVTAQTTNANNTAAAAQAEAVRNVPEPNLAKASQGRVTLPDWVNLKFTADFRLRYDRIDQNPKNYGPDPFPTLNDYQTVDRDRVRYRLRFGAIADLSDHLELGFRLGSGDVGSATPSLGSSIFSANSTLNNDANRKYLFVDLAYGKWTPWSKLMIEAGKMNNEFWFTDMVFDPDYNPEGAQEKFTLPIGDNHKISFTSGQLVILENFNGLGGTNLNNDVYMFINQLDWAAKWTPHISTRIGVAMINFKGQENITTRLEDFINQNGTRLDGTNQGNFNPQFLRYGLPPDMNPIIARAELTYTLSSFPGFPGPFPITIGGEYAQNPPASSDVNEAYNLGIMFGQARTKYSWSLAYNYKTIERSALWHGLNDDDFGFNGRGGTDVRGHQVIASFRPAQYFVINARYMKTEQISNVLGTSADQDRIFLDLVWGF